MQPKNPVVRNRSEVFDALMEEAPRAGAVDYRIAGRVKANQFMASNHIGTYYGKPPSHNQHQASKANQFMSSNPIRTYYDKPPSRKHPKARTSNIKGPVNQFVMGCNQQGANPINASNPMPSGSYYGNPPSSRNQHQASKANQFMASNPIGTYYGKPPSRKQPKARTSNIKGPANQFVMERPNNPAYYSHGHPDHPRREAYQRQHQRFHFLI